MGSADIHLERTGPDDDAGIVIQVDPAGTSKDTAPLVVGRRRSNG